MQPQSIQQINLSYDQHQDRLLMRAAVNDEQEIQVWITYRVARQIFKVFNQEAHLPVSGPAPLSEQSLPEATKQFAQEAAAVEALDELDFETAYQAPKNTVTDQTLLVVEMRFVSVNDQLNHVQLVCANGMNVNMNVNHELVLAITRMLLLAGKEAGWTLAAAPAKEPQPVSSIVMDIPVEKQVLH